MPLETYQTLSEKYQKLSWILTPDNNCIFTTADGFINLYNSILEAERPEFLEMFAQACVQLNPNLILKLTNTDSDMQKMLPFIEQKIRATLSAIEVFYVKYAIFCLNSLLARYKTLVSDLRVINSYTDLVRLAVSIEMSAVLTACAQLCRGQKSVAQMRDEFSPIVTNYARRIHDQKLNPFAHNYLSILNLLRSVFVVLNPAARAEDFFELCIVGFRKIVAFDWAVKKTELAAPRVSRMQSLRLRALSAEDASVMAAWAAKDEFIVSDGVVYVVPELVRDYHVLCMARDYLALNYPKFWRAFLRHNQQIAAAFAPLTGLNRTPGAAISDWIEFFAHAGRLATNQDLASESASDVVKEMVEYLASLPASMRANVENLLDPKYKKTLRWVVYEHLGSGACLEVARVYLQNMLDNPENQAVLAYTPNPQCVPSYPSRRQMLPTRSDGALDSLLIPPHLVEAIVAGLVCETPQALGVFFVKLPPAVFVQFQSLVTDENLNSLNDLHSILNWLRYDQREAFCEIFRERIQNIKFDAKELEKFLNAADSTTKNLVLSIIKYKVAELLLDPSEASRFEATLDKNQAYIVMMTVFQIQSTLMPPIYALIEVLACLHDHEIRKQFLTAEIMTLVVQNISDLKLLLRFLNREDYYNTILVLVRPEIIAEMSFADANEVVRNFDQFKALWQKINPEQQQAWASQFTDEFIKRFELEIKTEFDLALRIFSHQQLCRAIPRVYLACVELTPERLDASIKLYPRLLFWIVEQLSPKSISLALDLKMSELAADAIDVIQNGLIQYGRICKLIEKSDLNPDQKAAMYRECWLIFYKRYHALKRLPPVEVYKSIVKDFELSRAQARELLKQLINLFGAREIVPSVDAFINILNKLSPEDYVDIYTVCQSDELIKTPADFCAVFNEIKHQYEFTLQAYRRHVEKYGYFAVNVLHDPRSRAAVQNFIHKNNYGHEGVVREELEQVLARYYAGRKGEFSLFMFGLRNMIDRERYNAVIAHAISNPKNRTYAVLSSPDFSSAPAPSVARAQFSLR